MLASAYDDAMADEDEFECSSCSRPYRRRAPRTTIYRMTAETLARPRPAIATQELESALRHLDQNPSVFQRMGQIWVLKYEGQMILMKDAGGLHYVSRLLAEPDRTMPAAFLLAAEAGGDPRVLFDTPEQLIDNQALAAYKRRYSELEEELAEADKRNDLGRIHKLQSELESVGDEIIRVSGLGGKVRNKSEADKVRRRVSVAVTRAIDSIRAEHLRLGQHLRNSISSGFMFRYAPERDPGWLT